MGGERAQARFGSTPSCQPPLHTANVPNSAEHASRRHLEEAEQHPTRTISNQRDAAPPVCLRGLHRWCGAALLYCRSGDCTAVHHLYRGVVLYCWKPPPTECMSRRASTRSSSTISLTSSLKVVRGLHPSRSSASLGSPSSVSTSVGRK